MFNLFFKMLGVISVGILLSACADQAQTNPSESLADAVNDTAVEHAQKHMSRTYVCPMHPHIVRDAPGSCPICGMNLVEKKVEPVSTNPTVQISGAIAQAMNLRTVKVKRGSLQKHIKTIGSITYDEKHLVHVHPRAAGWVEKLRVRAEGDKVTRNQVLLDYYAPDILNAQVDFLIARRQAGISPSRLDKSRNRLRLLELPEYIINDIEKRNEAQNTVPLLAPQNGIITQLNIREGMYITPGTEIFTIADLTQMWVIVDVFEQQLAWVALGKSATMTVPAYPGKRWEGNIEYIYPDLDAQTRSLKVRLRFDNPELLLKPNLFAEVIIHSEVSNNLLKVPAQAIIRTGEREAVIKVTAKGSFQPIDVVTGSWHDNQVEILSGLREGEEIVISGQFLIDSEANMQASFARMQF